MVAINVEQALDQAVQTVKATMDERLAAREAADAEDRGKITKKLEELGAQVQSLELAKREHLARTSLPGVEYDKDGNKPGKALSLMRCFQLAAAEANPRQFGAFLTAKSHGYEREVMEQAGKRGMGTVEQTYNVGTDETGGIFVPHEVMYDAIIPQLEAQSVIRRAGATSISGLRGNISWIVEEGGTIAYYVDTEAEESITESAETFSSVTATPHVAAAMQKFSYLQLMQSAVGTEEWARDRMATKFALREDLSAISGTGTNSQPRGLTLVTGTASVDFDDIDGAGTDVVYTGASQTLSDAATQMVYALKNANAYDPAGTYAWVGQPEVGEKIAKAVDGDGRRLFVDHNTPMLDRWQGYNFLDSTQFDTGVTTNARLIIGDWSKLYLMTWGDMRIQAVQEGNDASKLRMSIIGSMAHDILCVRPEAFCIATNFDLNG